MAIPTLLSVEPLFISFFLCVTAYKKKTSPHVFDLSRSASRLLRRSGLRIDLPILSSQAALLKRE